MNGQWPENLVLQGCVCDSQFDAVVDEQLRPCRSADWIYLTSYQDTDARLPLSHT